MGCPQFVITALSRVRTNSMRRQLHRVLRPVRSRPVVFGASILAVGAFALVATVLPTTVADAAAVSVPLGTASSFAVLAGAGITNTGPTTVNGDIGSFPTTSISGTSTMTVNGTNQGGDAVTQQAKTDLVTAYNSAAAEGPTNPISADLGGQSLAPGVYNSASSIGLTGAVTLNGGGDPNTVFVFQAGSSLTTATASQVVLTNGAQACNVYWQVATPATLGTGSSFVGTILALTSITVTTAVTVDGRALARNGAVTLDSDTITPASCSAATTSTTTAAGTTSPTTTTTATSSAAATATAQQLAAVTAAKKAAAKKAAAKKAAAEATSTSATTTTVPGSTTATGFSAPAKHPSGFTG